jgi:hypothetical protein
MCVGEGYLTFDNLLYTKSEQKAIGNLFCTPIIFTNPLKTGFSLKNLLLNFVSGVFGMQ